MQCSTNSIDYNFPQTKHENINLYDKPSLSKIDYKLKD